MVSGERTAFHDSTNRIEGRRRYKPERFTLSQLRFIQLILDGKSLKDIAKEFGADFPSIQTYPNRIAQMMGELPIGGVPRSAQEKAAASKRIHRGFTMGVIKAVSEGLVNTDRLPKKPSSDLKAVEIKVWQRLMEGDSQDTAVEGLDLKGRDSPSFLKGFYDKFNYIDQLSVVNEFQAVAIRVKIVQQSQSTKGVAVSGS